MTVVQYYTAWKVSKYGVIFGPYLDTFLHRKPLMSACFWFFIFILSTLPITSFIIILRCCLRGFQEKLFTPSRLSNALLLSCWSLSHPFPPIHLRTYQLLQDLWATSAIFFSQETFLQSTISRSIAGSDSTTSASLDLSVKLLICAREETNEYDRNCSFYDVWWFYFKKSYCAYSV